MLHLYFIFVKRIVIYNQRHVSYILINVGSVIWGYEIYVVLLEFEYRFYRYVYAFFYDGVCVFTIHFFGNGIY